MVAGLRRIEYVQTWLLCLAVYRRFVGGFRSLILSLRYDFSKSKLLFCKYYFLNVAL